MGRHEFVALLDMIDALFWWDTAGGSVFMVNPVIPDKMIALVVNTHNGRETIWYGWVAELPEDEFNLADEAHVNQWTYDRIAMRAEATGKGTPLQ